MPSYFDAVWLQRQLAANPALRVLQGAEELSTAAPGYTLRMPGLRLTSETNAREHWRARAQRAKHERARTYYSLRCSHWPLLPLPLTIRVTRIAPKALDAHDNLPAACKHVVDGIADYLAGGEGQGQDQQPGLTWQYTQRREGARVYAVEITIVPEQEG